MIVGLLAFLFFASTVTFVVLYVMRKRELANNAKNDLATLLTEPGIIPSKKGVSNITLSSSEAECIADKYASAFDYDPVGIGLLIGRFCGGVQDKFSVCQKYIQPVKGMDINKVVTQCK